MKTALLFTLTLVLTSGCVFVPKDVTYFDEECQIYAQKTVLDIEAFKTANKYSRSCLDTCPVYNDSDAYFGFASLFVATAAVAAKNTQHWKERNQNCQKLVPKNTQPTMEEGPKSDISEIERVH
ncbi:hypothetical protein PSECIP111951_00084 [Pseudoalteromonas holothuriae]|uniref:Lipoprotein n=1 Tax=Pseudoalteromonas holothuriae TaxID=2963714 RepID=A0A9W4VNZ2_9GAMM|nr:MULTISPECIES: hypothetical protein [unclassified Pseudoalteromonas]CAH9049947.1 hypothetical protein PSECIP111951_00084 [Pseudoalteromonas sp. CIP111951]CAH9052752.1 hypothetical protein PSECIP111854_01035 [Pseudoalteromonas sp. CIP111854]